MGATEELSPTIDVSELARLSDRTAETVRAWCKSKGIEVEKGRVYMSDIEQLWPKMYASLKLRLSKRQPVCPCCGEPTIVSCSTCDYESH